MNNKIKQALNKVLPQTRIAYAQGYIPADMIVALSSLTFYEQMHFRYNPDPDDDTRSLAVGLFDDDNNPIVSEPDRIPYIQAAIEVFLEDQERARLKKKRRDA